MDNVINRIIMSVLCFGFVYSCQNIPEKKNPKLNSPAQFSEEAAGKSTPGASDSDHPGKSVYTKYCLVCHQADGAGIAGLHPPLTPGSWVGKDPNELIAIMMKGLSGKIEVNGEVYKSFMPSQAHLTDQEMADVLTYIRTGFGNNFGPVEAIQVRNIRSGK